jgi:hypothetical protein
VAYGLAEQMLELDGLKSGRFGVRVRKGSFKETDKRFT